MASPNVVEITDANFEEQVIKSDRPVLVDFWAECCQPCRMLTPTINKLATDYGAKIKVGKVDTDANHGIAAKYGINSIPTVILFNGGKVEKKLVGLRKEQDFKDALDAVLPKA